MKRGFLYAALSVVYISISLVVLTLYYWPEVTQYSSFSILEAPQLDEALLAHTDNYLAESEAPVASPFKLTISVDSLDHLVSQSRFDYYSWIAVVILFGGPLLVIFGLVFHREWAQKLIAALIIVSLFHIPPFVEARWVVPVDFDKPQEKLSLGDTVFYKIQYQNLSRQDLENVKLTIPIPQGTAYVHDSIVASQLSFELDGEPPSMFRHSDSFDQDDSFYAPDQEQLISFLSPVPAHSSDSGGFILLKLEVLESLSLSEITFQAFSEAKNGPSSDARLTVPVK